MGALRLYLDFINLFMMLLQLFWASVDRPNSQDWHTDRAPKGARCRFGELGRACRASAPQRIVG